MKYRLLVLALWPLVSPATEVAVTVDDLPTHGSLPKETTRAEVARTMIAVFRKHKVPEPYGFTNGQQLEEAPEHAAILQAWAAAGFPLGNHTWSHPNLEKVTAEAYAADIRKNEATLEKYGAGRDFRFFRYPYLREGSTTEKREAIRKALRDGGYKAAPATVYFDDWAWNESYARCADRHDRKEVRALEKSFLRSAMERLRWAEKFGRVAYGRPVRQILLLHIGAFDARVLDRLLSSYERAGVRWVKLPYALGDEAYANPPPVLSDREMTYWQQVAESRPGKYPDAPEVPLEALEKSCK